MKMYSEPARQIPVYAEVDVLVVGGGPAGATAAVAAARTGADTLVIENQACLGGALTASLTSVISGFRNQRPPNELQAVRGIPQEIILQLNRMGGIGKSPFEQELFDLSQGEVSFSYAIDSEKLKVLLMKMAEDAGCDVLLHTFATAPIVDQNRVQGVIVENKSGRQAIFARTIIDCTGDADIAHRAGAFCRNVPRRPDTESGPYLMYKVAGFQVDPSIPLPGILLNGSLLIYGPSVTDDNTSSWDISRSEIDLRTKVFDHFEALKAKYPLLQKASVVETPAMLSPGKSRTRYVQGEYTLTERDAITGAKFPDTIAVSSAPITQSYGGIRYFDHEGFDVPYRSLVPVRIDGLLMAGRCVSCEPQPYESLSSAACLMATGQAAGVAAAIVSERRILPRQLNVAELQHVLLQQGAELRRRTP